MLERQQQEVHLTRWNFELVSPPNIAPTQQL